MIMETIPNPPVKEQLWKQEIIWIAERSIWGIMSGIVFAAILGLFGGGLFSSRKEFSRDKSILMTYESFNRRTRESELQITLPANPRQALIVLPHKTVGDLDVVRTDPAPQNVRSLPNGIHSAFEFETRAEPNTITIRYRPRQVGQNRHKIQINNQDILFSQFVFP
jgi:hypothetical protein